MRIACLLWPPLCLAVLIPWSATLSWTAAQYIHCLWPLPSVLADRLQSRAWAEWDKRETAPLLPEMSITELPLNAAQPDRSRPFIVRGLLNGTAAISTYGGYDWLLRPPVGNLVVDYFSNATVKEGIVPDAKATVSEIVAAIAAGGPQKIGTEMIFRSFPSLLTDLGVADRLAPLLGSAGVLDEWRVGRMTTGDDDCPTAPRNGARHSTPRIALTDLASIRAGNQCLSSWRRERPRPRREPICTRSRSATWSASWRVASVGCSSHPRKAPTLCRGSP